MGRVALIAAAVATLSVIAAPPAGAATSGAQPYNGGNHPVTYSTTSPAYGTATATIQETAGQSTTGGWTFCAHHAVDGSSCAAASHVRAGTVSHWITSGATTLVTLPNGAGCYQHTDAAGVTWCYAGEPVQDSIGTTGGPFGATADTSVSSLVNQGEAWWGSGGGPNDVGACEGMFGNAPSDQASLPSCEQQFGTVTWDTSGGTVASIRSTADEMAWRVGSWNGSATPGGVSCGSRTAMGGIAADSQAPSGLWMQWASRPDRGFWNCTAQDGSAGPPQTSWNGGSWYSRAASDWNGFGWYLIYYDYASFIETPATAVNGVATSIACDGFSSGTTVSGGVPSAVSVSIDETTGLATFTDQAGTLLSEVSCTNSPTPRTTVTDAPPATGGDNRPHNLYAQNYVLSVPVGETGAVNLLTFNVYHDTPQLTLTANSSQPGTLDSDPSSIDFGYFTWSPTFVDQEVAQYQMCDSTGCASAHITLISSSTTTPTTTCEYYCGQPPPSTTTSTSAAPSPDVTLTESPTLFPGPGVNITLTGTARNPIRPSYDLRLQRLDDDQLLSDCGQTLSCVSEDFAPSDTTHRYVAILSYPDGTPSEYSNEIDVTWGSTKITLTACPTTAPCTEVSARAEPGATAYLTAEAHNAPPVDEYDQIYWKLVIVDEATSQPVGDCPIGETPCRVPVSQPGGTAKTYIAVFTWQYQYHPSLYSNPVDVRWIGTPPPPTTSPPPPPPPTTTPPPPPPPTTAPPPPPTTTSPPSSSPPPTAGAISPT